MNPWALVIVLIGVMLIIIGVQGSYGKVISALTGKEYNPNKSNQPATQEVHGHKVYVGLGPTEQ